MSSVDGPAICASAAVTTQGDAGVSLGVTLGGDNLGGDEVRSGDTGGAEANREQLKQLYMGCAACGSSGGSTVCAVTTLGDEVNGNQCVTLGGDNLGGDEVRSGGKGGSEADRVQLRCRWLNRGEDGYNDASAVRAVTTQGGVMMTDSMSTRLGGDSLGGDSLGLWAGVPGRGAPAACAR